LDGASRPHAPGRAVTEVQPVPQSIDEYIGAFSPELQAVLQKVRVAVREAAPEAQERMSYRMPAFFQDGALVYFAAFKKHIGFYPPVSDRKLKAELARYAGPKGNLRFPLDQPLPYALIRRIVKARLRDNLARKLARVRK
jgi:uncharacterized protein YdhG (YjbR/CyaY superfamily)